MHWQKEIILNTKIILREIDPSRGRCIKMDISLQPKKCSQILHSDQRQKVSIPMWIHHFILSTALYIRAIRYFLGQNESSYNLSEETVSVFKSPSAGEENYIWRDRSMSRIQIISMLNSLPCCKLLHTWKYSTTFDELTFEDEMIGISKKIFKKWF